MFHLMFQQDALKNGILKPCLVRICFALASICLSIFRCRGYIQLGNCPILMKLSASSLELNMITLILSV